LKEFKIYHACVWPEISVNFQLKDLNDDITELEKSIITKMRMRKGAEESTLQTLWCKDRSRISSYVRQWSPKWGAVGKALSILDVDALLLDELKVQ
jgi:hypothetical protein